MVTGLMDRWMGLVLCVVIFSLTGCSGGGDGGGTSGGGSQTGIGPAGGTVTSSDGKTSVNIPAGALSQETPITVEPASNPPSGNIGTAYEFGPSGTTFSQPVTISITYDEANLPSGTSELNLKLATLVNNQWQEVSGSSVDTTSNIVTGTTSSFSIYGVIASSSSVTYPGVFGATGSMSVARFGHTATLLPNGKVLVAGNFNFAELYDPVSGGFSGVAGTMNGSRVGHSATLLPSGKILLAGGSSLASAELYDPTSGTTGGFSNTGSMSTVRTGHTATLLPNGKVLITGGSDNTGSALATAELYDPATGTFRPTNNTMNKVRMRHTATLLPNGKVLIAGGLDAPLGSVQRSAELYDPSTGTFTTIGDMAAGTAAHTATLLPNGKVLITGGVLGVGSITSYTQLYDPGTGTFSPSTIFMKTARVSHTATLLSDGKVLITGGCCTPGGFDPLDTAELYDPTTGTFSPTGSMTIARQEHTATLLSDGEVLITGTRSFSDDDTSAELFLIVRTVPLAPTGLMVVTGDGQASISWNPVSGATSYNLYMASLSGVNKDNYSSLPDGMKHEGVTSPFTHTGLTNGTTYYFVVTAVNVKGEGAESIQAPGTPNASSIAGNFIPVGNMGIARRYHTATLLPNGKILIAGGFNPNTLPGGATATAELYDPVTGTFSPTGSMSTGRFVHTATLLPNGKVLMVGGGYNSTGGDVTLASAELYDPVSGTFSPTGSMNTARDGHTGTLLPNGKILITGGTSRPNDGDPFNDTHSAELYDPATGTFSPTGSMIMARSRHTATLLSNGKVLIVGGSTSGAELYNPVTGKFTSAGSMSTGHSNPTATLLPNGKVLIAGGSTSGAELYDPDSGTFSPTGSLIVARFRHSATLLQNGKVLIAGEFDSSIGTGAELYDPVSGTFSPTGSMSEARYNHTATLLPDGNVLIAGGSYYSFSTGELTLASAELFQ